MQQQPKTKLPENPKWISVSYGCPQKNVKKVRVLLSNGKVGYGMYINRERVWMNLDGKILNNVKAWRLLPDSLQTLDTEPQTQQGNVENVNYKENCNYPHIEEAEH